MERLPTEGNKAELGFLENGSFFLLISFVNEETNYG